MPRKRDTQAGESDNAGGVVTMNDEGRSTPPPSAYDYEAIRKRARQARSLIAFNKDRKRYELKDPSIDVTGWEFTTLFGDEREPSDMHYIIRVLDTVIKNNSEDDASAAVDELPDVDISDLLTWLNVATHSVEFVDDVMDVSNFQTHYEVKTLGDLLRVAQAWYYDAIYVGVMDTLNSWVLEDNTIEDEGDRK